MSNISNTSDNKRKKIYNFKKYIANILEIDCDLIFKDFSKISDFNLDKVLEALDTLYFVLCNS